MKKHYPIPLLLVLLSVASLHAVKARSVEEYVLRVTSVDPGTETTVQVAYSAKGDVGMTVAERVTPFEIKSRAEVFTAIFHSQSLQRMVKVDSIVDGKARASGSGTVVTMSRLRDRHSATAF